MLRKGTRVKVNVGPEAGRIGVVLGQAQAHVDYRDCAIQIGTDGDLVAIECVNGVFLARETACQILPLTRNEMQEFIIQHYLDVSPPEDCARTLMLHGYKGLARMTDQEVTDHYEGLADRNAKLEKLRKEANKPNEA